MDGFGRQKPFRGRVGTRSGRARDAPKPARGRSWDAPGAPRAAGRRPRATPGRSQDVPEPVRSDVGARTARQAPSDASSGRFFVVFVLSRESSDVLFVPVFTVFCWVRTKLTRNACERLKPSKIMPFRPPKSSPGASAGPKIEPKRPSSSGKPRSKRLQGLRKFISERERCNFERQSATGASEERAAPRGLRAGFSESLNGFSP